MDVTILNTNLDAVSIVDTYESFIWTDRYYAYGDFELYEAMRDGLLNYIKQDYYLQSKESEHVMIVEKIQITSDTEDGNHVTVTGRSLESILDRRIVWGQKLLSGNLQNGIKTLLNENVISPSDSNRKIPNFIFKESTLTKGVNRRHGWAVSIINKKIRPSIRNIVKNPAFIFSRRCGIIIC